MGVKGENAWDDDNPALLGSEGSGKADGDDSRAEGSRKRDWMSDLPGWSGGGGGCALFCWSSSREVEESRLFCGFDGVEGRIRIVIRLLVGIVKGIMYMNDRNRSRGIFRWWDGVRASRCYNIIII